MLTIDRTQSALSIPKAFRVVCLVSGSFAVLLIAFTLAAYLPTQPDFSPMTTFLSDIGDTPGWPQVIFNSGSLIVAPLRYLVLVLLVLYMYHLGAGRGFGNSVLIIGALATIGTILMTAVPVSVGRAIHMTGIPLYFLGVVPLQIIIGWRELSLKGIPRLLPVISFLLAGAYLVFFVLMVFYLRGILTRTTVITPMIWQWIGFTISIIWVFAHGLLLGEN